MEKIRWYSTALKRDELNIKSDGRKSGEVLARMSGNGKKEEEMSGEIN